MTTPTFERFVTVLIGWVFARRRTVTRMILAADAVERTSPTAMLLYSFILLWFAKHGHLHYQPPHASWYLRKTRASFADMLATLRRESVREQVSALAPSGKGCRKLRAVLRHTVQQAA